MVLFILLPPVLTTTRKKMITMLSINFVKISIVIEKIKAGHFCFVNIKRGNLRRRKTIGHAPK